MNGRFEMLLGLYGDPEMAEIFSEARTLQTWLDVEVALARAQAAHGVIADASAAALAAVAFAEKIDTGVLWSETKTVGYPILPMLRQIDSLLPEEHRGRVHLGATTQDIMDSGLAIQLTRAARRIDVLVDRFGSAILVLAQDHLESVTAARTHAQQAVPTVFGAKLAVYVDQLARHRARLREMATEAGVLSMHGAGGTSAGYGALAPALREHVAAALDLRATDVPWHVARDSLARFIVECALASTTAARFAREVIDLSRTEIAEVAEARGHLRGASSTMPQKRNPILSEVVVGLAAAAGALASGIVRTLEAGHERAAGEWQLEWHIVPEVLCLGSSALMMAGELAHGLRVFPERMRQNMELDDGLIMAEAYMMDLAPSIGREAAHELVYSAASRTRETGEPLHELLTANDRHPAPIVLAKLEPVDYLGDPGGILAAARSAWIAGGGTDDGSEP